MRQHGEKDAIGTYIRREKSRKRWKRAVAVLSAIALIVTVSLMSLPGLTLEGKAGQLQCQLDLHTHTDSCYDEEGNLICGYADFVVHTHDSSCYDEEGNLICPLPEIQAHNHDSSCYQQTRVLTCTQEECEGHTHGEDCYQQTPVLICGLEESEGHTHTAGCYEKRDVLVCGQEESQEHIHTAECYEEQDVLVCTQEEREGHTHTEDCYTYEDTLVCAQEECEGHTHTEACYTYEDTLVCAREEIILHTHDASCYDAGGNLICGLLEVREHVHDESCLQQSGDTSSQADDGSAGTRVNGNSDTGLIVMSSGVSVLDDGTIDLSQYITSSTVEKDQNGQWVAVDDTVVSGDHLRVTLNYAFDEGVVTSTSRIAAYQITGIRINEQETGSVTQGDNIVGSYTITTDGLVTITFWEDFADGQAFNGYLNFMCWVAATGEGGDDQINFGYVGGTITVEPNNTESDLTIEKEGTFSKPDGLICYTITISAELGSNGKIALSDAFQTTGVDYVGDSFVLTKAGEEVTVAPQIIARNGAVPASFTISGLDALEAGESYVLTYTAQPDLTRTDADGSLTISNQAAATDNSHMAQAAADVTVYGKMAEKEGYYNSITNIVTWWVRINPDGRDINGMTITDELLLYVGTGSVSTSVTLPAQVTLEMYDGETLVGAKQIALPYTVPEEESRYTYWISYETDVQTLSEQLGDSNYASLTNTVYLDEYEAEFTVPFYKPGDSDFKVVKGLWNRVAGSPEILSWGNTIIYPEDLSDASQLTCVDWLMDVYDESTYTMTHGTHYTTLKLLLHGGFWVSGLNTTTAATTPLTMMVDYDLYVLPVSEVESIYSACSDNVWNAYAYLQRIGLTDNLNWTKVDWNLSNDTTPIAAFKLVFNDSALTELEGDPIQIGYYSYLDTSTLPVGMDMKVMNAVRVQDFTTSYIFGETIQAKLDKQASPTGLDVAGNGVESYTDEDFEVNLYAAKGLLHYRLLLRQLNLEGGEPITITDTLPAGAEFVESSLRLIVYDANGVDSWEASAEALAQYVTVSQTTNADGITTVTFTLQNYDVVESGDVAGIYYDVSVQGDDWDAMDSKAYINTAVWGATTDSTTTTVWDEQPVVGKYGEQVLDDNGAVSELIRYQVVVNPTAEDLDPERETIELEDVLTIPDGSVAAFRPETVKVCAYDADAEDNCGAPLPVEQYSARYDSDTNTLLFTLPDATALVVVYDYEIDRGSIAGSLEISNVATLSGDAAVSSDFDLEMQEQSSSAGVNKATLRIYKHDADNVALLLPGARFKLERYEIASGETTYGWHQSALTTTEADGTFLVPDSGYIELNYVSYVENPSLYNTLYRLTEVAAPTGYISSSDYYYFVWMEENATEEDTIRAMETAGAVPEGFSFEAEDVLFVAYSTSESLFVPNTKIQFRLPETGGAGTAAYTVGGLILVGAACVGYRFKRRGRKGGARG